MEKNVEKKQYKSKKEYSKKWASSNINVSLDRETVENLKNYLDGKQTIKSYIESLIKNSL